MIKHKRVGVTIVCTHPPSFWGRMGGRGVELLIKFSKREGASKDLTFQRVVAHKKRNDFFQRRKGGKGCSFYIKNKLKYKIFNDKKNKNI